MAVRCLVIGIEKNVIISMPSNSGKSLCYLMPRFFWSSGIVLVISSHISRITIEIEFLTELNIPATTITSKTSYIDRDAIIESFRDNQNCPYLFFYVTPEMMVNGSEKVKLFVDYLLRTHVCLVAVDEAQMLVDTNFRESYQELRRKRIEFPNIPWIALTTASHNTLQKIASSLSMKNTKFIIKSCVRNDIFQDVKFLKDKSNLKDMIFDLIEPTVKLEDVTQKTYNAGIIYCENYEEADDIAEQLSKSGVPSESYHLMKDESHTILKKWKEGIFPILVTHEGAFNVAISISLLKFVVFMSFPKTMRTFYQRSGKINVHGGRSRVIYTPQTGYVNFEVSSYIRTCLCRHQFIAMSICEEAIKPCESKCDNCVSGYSNRIMNAV